MAPWPGGGGRPLEGAALGVEPVRAKGILTRTGGFLGAFTHTLNPWTGCAYGRHACGVACYAAELRYGADRARTWGHWLGRKEGAADLYEADARRERRRGRPLRIYMSSVTDPYPPEELRHPQTRPLLERMLAVPPDLLVVQTHTPHAARDADVLRALADAGTRLAVQVSVETDREEVPFLGRHAYPVARRLEALGALRQAGIPAVCVVAPMLPVADAPRFARDVARVADFAILDHWRLGDGSRNGARTRRPRTHAPLPLPDALEAAGYGRWNDLAAFEEVRDAFVASLGEARVGVSCAGFEQVAEWVMV